jgi:co-chaperonin GroES (HSP10)
MKVPLLPPKLEARMQKYGIEMPPRAAVFDRCIVYPLIGKDDDQSDRTAGGIILPQDTRDRLVAQEGILLSAGPRAIEILYSHGISLGDRVLVAQFSTRMRTYMSASKRLHRILLLRAEEVVASEDLATAYAQGDLWLNMTEEGKVKLHDRERIDPVQSDEGMPG